MKRTAILASAGAVALGFSLVVCVVPAGAQGSNANGGGFTQQMDLNKLPKVKPYKAPIQIQFVDAGPKFTDCRETETKEVIQFRVPPLPPGQVRTTVVDVPANGSGNGMSTVDGGAPGTITIDTSRPPAARFGTNIPIGGPRGAANPLPNGTTTNRLMRSQSNTTGKMNAPTFTVKKGDLLRSTTKPASATPTMTYKESENNFATGSAMSQKTIKTNLTGTLKSPVKRGEYLKPPQ